MKSRVLLFYLLMVILCSSCAKHIEVLYSADRDNNNTLILKPSADVQGTNVTVNDRLVVENKFVKKVTVRGIPDGENTYHFTSNSGMYKEKINFTETLNFMDGEEKTKLLDIPPLSSSYWTYLIVSSLVSAVIIAIL